MNILNAGNNLLVHLGSLFLLKSPVLHYVLEKFPARTVLHDQVKIIVILNHFIQLNHVRVPHFFEDRDLPIDSVDVRLVLYFIFFQNFDGYFVPGHDVSALLHFSKCALALGFADDEATDLLSFAVLLFFRFGILDCKWLRASLGDRIDIP